MERELESILNGLEEEGYSTSSISKAVHSLDEYQVKSRIELFQLLSNASFQDDPKTLHRALEALVANNEKLIPQTPEDGLAQHCPTLLQLSTQIKEISEQALKEKSTADLKFQLNEFKNSINNGNLPEAAWCILNLENLAAKERELENETKLASDADTLMLRPSKEYSLNRSSANESIGKATNAESSFINSPLCNGKLEDKNASTALAISRLATSCRLELEERLNVAWTNILVPVKRSSLDSSKPLTIAAARSRGWIRKLLDSDPLFCIPELSLTKFTDVGESREPLTNDGITLSSSFPKNLYVQATVPSILEAAKVLGFDSQLLQKLADVILHDLLDPILKQKAAKGAVRIVSDSDPVLSKMLESLPVDNDKANGTNGKVDIVLKKGFSEDSGSTSHGGGGGGGGGDGGGSNSNDNAIEDSFDDDGIHPSNNAPATPIMSSVGISRIQDPDFSLPISPFPIAAAAVASAEKSSFSFSSSAAAVAVAVPSMAAATVAAATLPPLPCTYLIWGSTARKFSKLTCPPPPLSHHSAPLETPEHWCQLLLRLIAQYILDFEESWILSLGGFLWQAISDAYVRQAAKPYIHRHRDDPAACESKAQAAADLAAFAESLQFFEPGSSLLAAQVESLARHAFVGKQKQYLDRARDILLARHVRPLGLRRGAGQDGRLGAALAPSQPLELSQMTIISHHGESGVGNGSLGNGSLGSSSLARTPVGQSAPRGIWIHSSLVGPDGSLTKEGGSMTHYSSNMATSQNQGTPTKHSSVVLSSSNSHVSNSQKSNSSSNSNSTAMHQNKVSLLSTNSNYNASALFFDALDEDDYDEFEGDEWRRNGEEGGDEEEEFLDFGEEDEEDEDESDEDEGEHDEDGEEDDDQDDEEGKEEEEEEEEEKEGEGEEKEEVMAETVIAGKFMSNDLFDRQIRQLTTGTFKARRAGKGKEEGRGGGAKDPASAESSIPADSTKSAVPFSSATIHVAPPHAAAWLSSAESSFASSSFSSSSSSYSSSSYSTAPSLPTTTSHRHDLANPEAVSKSKKGKSKLGGSSHEQLLFHKSRISGGGTSGGGTSGGDNPNDDPVKVGMDPEMWNPVTVGRDLVLEDEELVERFATVAVANVIMASQSPARGAAAAAAAAATATAAAKRSSAGLTIPKFLNMDRVFNDEMEYNNNSIGHVDTSNDPKDSVSVKTSSVPDLFNQFVFSPSSPSPSPSPLPSYFSSPVNSTASELNRDSSSNSNNNNNNNNNNSNAAAAATILKDIKAKDIIDPPCGLDVRHLSLDSRGRYAISQRMCQLDGLVMQLLNDAVRATSGSSRALSEALVDAVRNIAVLSRTLLPADNLIETTQVGVLTANDLHFLADRLMSLGIAYQGPLMAKAAAVTPASGEEASEEEASEEEKEKQLEEESRKQMGKEDGVGMSESKIESKSGSAAGVASATTTTTTSSSHLSLIAASLALPIPSSSLGTHPSNDGSSPPLFLAEALALREESEALFRKHLRRQRRELLDLVVSGYDHFRALSDASTSFFRILRGGGEGGGGGGGGGGRDEWGGNALMGSGYSTSNNINSTMNANNNNNSKTNTPNHQSNSIPKGNNGGLSNANRRAMAYRRTTFQILHSFGRLGKGFCELLAPQDLVTAAADLIGAVCTAVVNDVLGKSDLAAEDCEEIVSVISPLAADCVGKILSSKAGQRFSGMPYRAVHAAILAACAPLRRLRGVLLVLQADSLRTVEALWSGGTLEAHDVSVYDLENLILTLCDDSPARQALLIKIFKDIQT